MPPKKAEKGQVKAEEKKKVKVAEDKTFGLKNKNKSKAVQKFIKGVHNQAKTGPQKSDQTVKDDQLAQKEQKKKDRQQDALLNSLFKGAENAKALSQIKSSCPETIKEEQKIDLYVDQRQNKSMEGWDQATLEEVINSKHGDQNATSTEIICKHFIDAVEKKQYGWFWMCPNGGDTCKYKHSLPPGYVLKAEVAEEADDEEEPLEEIVERERAALPLEGTPVTLESLKEWKKRKEEQRLWQLEEKRKAEARRTGGKGLNVLSGRDLFAYDPTLFFDDEGAAEEVDYDDEENESDDSSDDTGGNDASGDDSDDGDDGDGEATPSSCAPKVVEGEDIPSTTISGASVKRPDLFLEHDVPDLDDFDDV